MSDVGKVTFRFVVIRGKEDFEVWSCLFGGFEPLGDGKWHFWSSWTNLHQAIADAGRLANESHVPNYVETTVDVWIDEVRTMSEDGAEEWLDHSN